MIRGICIAFVAYSQHTKGSDPMTEERVKRKLSAILSADVAGYSRLMGDDGFECE